MKRTPQGYRCGDSHHMADLSDEEVRRMRELYVPYVMGYEKLAAMFQCGVSTARDICTYRTRITRDSIPGQNFFDFNT